MTLKISPKVILIVTGAGIAALGTMPYGFRFASSLETYNYFLFLVSGSFFAVTAALANAALGSYSLLHARLSQDLVNPYFLLAGSFASAVPFGFSSYFGYEAILPFAINLLISLIIVIVNTAIAYTAIYNFLIYALKKREKKSLPFYVVSKIGFVIGMLVSVTIYAITVHGLTQVLSHLTHHKNTAFYIACGLGIVAWIPFAALYSDSTRTVSEKIYSFFTERKSIKKEGNNKRQLFILIIAIGSASAFCQTASEFFKPDKDIPVFFKNAIAQTFIDHFLVPCAFISAAAVAYLALTRLYSSLVSSAP